MKDQIEKQAIEEMARIIDDNHGFIVSSVETAEALYNVGYRKQSEWISVDERLPTEDERRDEYGELVPFLEATGDFLDCRKCPLDCKCKNVEVSK